MRLYIIRHADPDYENDTITPDGVMEARALAESLTDWGLTALYTSPMGRARKTASYTAETAGLPLQVLDWTMELSHLRHPDTPYGSVAAWDIPGEVYLPIQYGEYRSESHDGFYPDEAGIDPELEKLGTESDRFLEGFGYRREKHVYNVAPDAQETAQIAVFCHNGFGLAWLSHLLSIPYRLVWPGFWLAPTSVSTILLEKRSPQTAVPRALCIGGTSHLASAGITPKPSGIKANYY